MLKVCQQRRCWIIVLRAPGTSELTLVTRAALSHTTTVRAVTRYTVTCPVTHNLK